MQTIQVKHLSTHSQAMRGLIGKKNIYAVYFQTRFGIHTFGMQAPIDVLILDGKNSVVKMKKKLVPNRLFFWLPIYSHVIELPHGYVDEHAIYIGETIVLER